MHLISFTMVTTDRFWVSIEITNLSVIDIYDFLMWLPLQDLIFFVCSCVQRPANPAFLLTQYTSTRILALFSVAPLRRL